MVSVINLKGGVGKTTVVSLLARHIVDSGMNVLAVDLDPQSNLSQALMERDRYKNFMSNKGFPSIVELVEGYGYKYGDMASVLRRRHRPYVYGDMTGGKYLPVNESRGTGRLDTIFFGYNPVWRGHRKESTLRLIPSRFNFSDRLVEVAKKDDERERILAKYITAHAGDEDLVLIDCAPTDSIFTRIAYHASHYVLIPVKTEFFSAIGFPLLAESLTKFNDGRADDGQVKVCGIIINNSAPGKPGKAAVAARADIEKEAMDNQWEKKIMKSELSYAQAYAKLPQDEAAKYVKRKHRNEIRWMTEEFLHLVGLPSVWEKREKIIEATKGLE